MTCARLIDVKNIDQVLDALALASKRHGSLALLIVGEGPLRSRLEERVSNLGLDSGVKFLGYLPHDELSLLYHMSDVFLLPTLYEGHPRALLEARLAGLPVIASTHGSVRELVTNDLGGLLVDPLSVDAIADAMVELAGNVQLRDRFRRDPTFDPSLFSIEAVSAQEEVFYLEAISVFRKGLEDRAQARARHSERTGNGD